MKKLDLKLGLGRSIANEQKKTFTEKDIKARAIELVNKHKKMQTNLEEDNLDLYTSYFGGPGSSENYKLQLKQDYTKRFKLGSTIEVQRNRKVVITKGNPEDRKRTRPNQLSGVKRKSKFSDVIPNTANDITNKPVIVNSAIQIINKAVTINSAIIQQPDEYIGFVPPEYQTQDYSHLDNFNSDTTMKFL